MRNGSQTKHQGGKERVKPSKIDEENRGRNSSHDRLKYREQRKPNATKRTYTNKYGKRKARFSITGRPPLAMSMKVR